MVSVDGVPGGRQADRVHGLRDRLREQIRKRREAVVAEGSAAWVTGPVRPGGFGPSLHSLVGRTRVRRVDAQAVHEIDIPPQLHVGVHVGRVAGDDRGAHRGSRERAVPGIRKRLHHRRCRMRAQGVLRVERGAPRRVVLHDHGFDAAGGLRVDDVEVREVPEVQQRTSGRRACARGRRSQDVETRDIRLAGSGHQSPVRTLNDTALQNRLLQGRRDACRGLRCRLCAGDKTAPEDVDVQSGGGSERCNAGEEVAAGQSGHRCRPFGSGDNALTLSERRASIPERTQASGRSISTRPCLVRARVTQPSPNR